MNRCRSEWGLLLQVDTNEGCARFWWSLFDAETSPKSSSWWWRAPLMLVLQVVGPAPTIKAWSAAAWCFLRLDGWILQGQLFSWAGVSCNLLLLVRLPWSVQAHLDPSRSAKNINRSSCCSSCLCTQSTQRRQRFQLSFSSHNNKYRKLKLIRHLVD